MSGQQIKIIDVLAVLASSVLALPFVLVVATPFLAGF